MLIIFSKITGLSEITVRTDIARGIKAITENRIHLNRRKTHLGRQDLLVCLSEYKDCHEVITDLLAAYVALLERRPCICEARSAKPVTSSGLFLIVMIMYIFYS